MFYDEPIGHIRPGVHFSVTIMLFYIFFLSQGKEME